MCRGFCFIFPLTRCRNLFYNGNHSVNVIFSCLKFPCLVVCFDGTTEVSYGRVGDEYNTRKGNKSAHLVRVLNHASARLG